MDNNYKQTETMETESMEHRQDWKIMACLSAQEFSFFSCKPKIHYRVYKNMKLVHFPFFLITTQINIQK